MADERETQPEPVALALARLIEREFPGDPPAAASLPPLGAAQARRPRRVRRGFVFGFALAVPAAVALVLLPRPPEEESLSFDLRDGHLGADHAVEAPGTGPARLRFSDGTELLLASGSRGRIGALAAGEASFELRSGDAEVDVTLRPRRRWTLHAGPYAVEVLGARFAIAWRADREELDVRLREGQVRVTGPRLADGAVVTAGQRLLATMPRAELQVGGAQEPPAPPDGPPPRPAVHRASSPRPSVSAHVAAGDFSGAVAEAERGGLTRLLTSGSAEDLVALADAARYVKQPALARRALEATRKRFAGQRAAEAAFALGRLAEDVDRDERAAARWFERYRREAPRGRFVSESLGRQMSALARAGEGHGARAIAREYLERFPNGTYASVATRLLDER